MELAKKIAEKARAAGSVKESTEYFAVTEKREVDLGGGQTTTVDVPNGKHRVKILAEKLGKGKGYEGREQEELQMVIMDNGKQKVWNVPLKNADGTLYYLIEKLESIELNEEFIVEAVKMKNGKYAKQISKVGAAHAEELPTVRYDDHAIEEGIPSLDEPEGISLDEIPF